MNDFDRKKLKMLQQIQKFYKDMPKYVVNRPVQIVNHRAYHMHTGKITKYEFRGNGKVFFEVKLDNTRIGPQMLEYIYVEFVSWKQKIAE